MTPNSAPPSLAFFDVDGTLTTSDTMFVYTRMAAGLPRLVLALLLTSPWLVAMKLGLADRGATKARLLRHALAGRTRGELESAARRFARETMPTILRPRGRDAIVSHQNNGHRVVLVSASVDLWLAPWAELMGVELVCTQAAWVGDRFVGLASPNCRGAEKPRRIEQAVGTLPEDAVTIAYGDSSGDTEMLAWATEGHFRPFHD